MSGVAGCFELGMLLSECCRDVARVADRIGGIGR